jgi:hypothetical protein
MNRNPIKGHIPLDMLDAPIPIRRTWKERLFTWPWTPWKVWKKGKTLREMGTIRR